jgi:autoinducer 2-degrading protein
MAQAAGPFNFATSQDPEIARFSYHPLMFILQVDVRVKPDQVEAFREATTANSKGSLAEPGIARFDVLQNEEDPTRFMLVEAYRHREAAAAHKETPHYLTWVQAVTPMIAEPRTRSWWTSVHPGDEAW